MLVGECRLGCRSVRVYVSEVGTCGAGGQVVLNRNTQETNG